MSRYIDADLMSKAENHAFSALKEKYPNAENYFSYEDVHSRIQLLIKGAPTADDEIFNMLSENCKYYHVGFDEDRVACDTCRHKDNIPAGHSWGICDKDHCPIFTLHAKKGGEKL